MSLRLLAEDDRPREKFLQKGKSALSDAELLAIILKSGHREQSVIELAREILRSVDNNWHQLSRLTLADLQKFKGVGLVKAIEILCALEIGKRRALQDIPERHKIVDSASAYAAFQPHLADLSVEEFWVMYVNQSNRVLHLEKLSSGGITFSTVDIRMIFKGALERFATGIFIAHNHPSGQLTPSHEDKNITKQIKAAGEVLTVRLIDHLIINPTSYFSFADEGLL